ncbi:MAG: hypothetical protein AAF938_03975 [Myxococcota bacterium]
MYESLSDVSFSDSAVVSFTKEGLRLSVTVRLWNDVLVDMHFEEALAMYECMVGDLDAVVVRENATSEFARRAAADVSGCSERPEPVTAYRFVDVNERVMMEVVVGQGSKVSLVSRGRLES